MKSLVSIISENLTIKQSDIIADIILSMFSNTKSLTTNIVVDMLSALDLDIIHKIEESIYKTNKQKFIPYYSDSDEFLKAKTDNNIRKNVINQLADFLVNINQQ